MFYAQVHSRPRSSPRTLTMYPPYRVSPNMSTARSTPCLEYEPYGSHESPADDYLDTPNLNEWREVRRLFEDQKMLLEQAALADTSFNYDLPGLDTFSHNQRPLLSELPSQLPPWPHTTIAPKDAFSDYQEVQKFLQEQARPASPSVYSDDYSSSSSSPYPSYNEQDLYFDDGSSISSSSRVDARSTPATSTASMSPVHHSSPGPSRRVGEKAKREDDDEYEHAPAPKRRMPPSSSSRASSSRGTSRFNDDDSDDDSDAGDDNATEYEDESGDFRPAGRVPQRKPKAPARASTRPATARPRASAVGRTAAPKSKAKSKVKKDSDGEGSYKVGPCDCRGVNCTSCKMTCFYTFVHGDRVGQVCRRLFECGRHLDLRRHKATHAVAEWQLLRDGEITLDMAQWYAVELEGKERGLVCPNGECPRTFTRYDALKRHMDKGSCDFGPPKQGKDVPVDPQIKAKRLEASDRKNEELLERRRRMAAQA